MINEKQKEADSNPPVDLPIIILLTLLLLQGKVLRCKRKVMHTRGRNITLDLRKQ